MEMYTELNISIYSSKNIAINVSTEAGFLFLRLLFFKCS
jgi:hypothetical protein